MSKFADKINHNKLSWLVLIVGVFLVILSVITNSSDIDKLATKVMGLGLFFGGFSVYLHFWRGNKHDTSEDIDNDSSAGFAIAVVLGTAIVVAFS